MKKSLKVNLKFLVLMFFFAIPFITKADPIIILAKKLQEQYSKNISNKRYVTIVDFSKSIIEYRLYVIDMKKEKIILKSKVAHGIRSGLLFASKFSDVNGSKMSSLGAFISKGTYYGTWGYSMKLKGLEFQNKHAEERTIVFHSVKKMKTKWSSGCFSVPDEINKELINLIKDGTLIYATNQKF